MEILQQEKLQYDQETFKDDFHRKIQQLEREVHQKKSDLQQLQKIKEYEIQKMKSVHQASLEESNYQNQEQ